MFARALAARPLLRLLPKTVARSMATEVGAAGTAAKAEKDGLYLTFASPAQSFYKDIKVRQVDVPSYSGSMGILAKHVPILATLKPGVVTVFEEDGAAKKYFVAAGTVTVNEDSSLLVLASEAVAVEDLDTSAAQKNLAAAQAAGSGAEAQIQVEVNQAILSAN